MTNKELRDLLSNHADLYVIADHIEENDEETTEEKARDTLTDAINEQEIIYYSKAIEYLKDNDASLCESIRIAHDYGYELKNINSELLATLLYQRNLSEELENFLSKVF